MTDFYTAVFSLAPYGAAFAFSVIFVSVLERTRNKRERKARRLEHRKQARHDAQNVNEVYNMIKGA